jgi:hypothetical protein
MGRGVISLLLAIGGAAWLYNKFQRSSGNNTRQSAIASLISAVVIFLVVFVILGMITK